MATIIFEIGGKEIIPSQIANSVEKNVYLSIVNSLQARFAGVKCPDHAQEPTLIVVGPSIDQITFDVKGCCQTLLDKVHEQAGK